MAGKPVAASWRCGCWLLWGCVCRWAAARPRDRHTRAFGSESSISKPGQVLRTLRHPPHRWGFSLLCTSHPGPAAKPHSQASLVPQLTRRPPNRRCLVCWWVIGVVLKPGYALPPPTGTHRHPPAPRPGSAGLAVPSMREPAAGSRRSRSPAKPSGPSGTLHTGGAFHCCAHPIQASPPTGTAAKPHSQASFVPQLTRCPPRRRCLVCWWVIGVVLKPGQVLPPPTGTHRHRGQAPRASRCPQQRAVPGVLVGDRRRFEARPGPAPAHRHPPAPRPGSAGLAVPSTKGGAWCAGGVIGVVLKPGYALPPPTGTAMGTSRRLYACVGFQSGLLGGAALGAGWRRVVGVSRL